MLGDLVDSAKKYETMIELANQLTDRNDKTVEYIRGLHAQISKLQQASAKRKPDPALQSKLEGSRATVVRLKEENQRLQNNLTRSCAEQDRLRERVSSVETEVTTAEEQLHELKNKVRALRVENDRIQGQH